MDTDALYRILLRQPCINRDAVVLCKLLCCSKALGSMISDLCSGQVLLHIEVPSTGTAMHLQHWLAKHAHLLQELHLLPHGKFKQQPFVELLQAEPSLLERDSAVTQGLQKAAAAGGLQLQSLRFISCGFADGTVLQYLPSSALTQLELHLGKVPTHTEKQYEHVSLSLARLTKLHHLVFDEGPSFDYNGSLTNNPVYGRALASLQHLTQLHLRATFTTEDLVQLPASLVEVRLECQGQIEGVQASLRLHHLVAATQLHIGHGAKIVFTLQAEHRLPPHLQTLGVSAAFASEPILQLQRLQELYILDCIMPPEELLRLKQLTALTALGLSYLEHYLEDDDGQQYELADLSAHIWNQLTMVQLSLLIDQAARPTVEALGQLTGLTHMHLGFCEFAVRPYQLARQLLRLTNLQRLWMDDWSVSGLPAPENYHNLDLQTRMQMLNERASVLSAVATLPRLKCLALYGERWNGDLKEIAAATQLTGLVLQSCEVDDATVMHLASSLTNLRHLQLPSASAVCLPALANLKHLTALQMPMSCIEEEIKQFTRLHGVLGEYDS